MLLGVLGAGSVPSSPVAPRAGFALGAAFGVSSPVPSCSSVNSRPARQSEVRGAEMTLLMVFTR